MNCNDIYKALLLYFIICKLLAVRAPTGHTFLQFNAPCQMNNAIFQSAKLKSIIHCAWLCNTNGFGPCSRFKWVSETLTCMLHSNNLYPGTSPVTVMSQIGWMIFGRKHADCTTRGFDFDSETMTCIGFKETGNVTWYEASSLCTQDGGDLISLTSTEKIQFALGYVYCKNTVGLKGLKWVTGVDFDENGYGFGFQLNDYDKEYKIDREMNCSILAPRSQDVFQDNSCSMRTRTKILCEVVIA